METNLTFTHNFYSLYAQAILGTTTDITSSTTSTEGNKAQHISSTKLPYPIKDTENNTRSFVAYTGTIGEKITLNNWFSSNGCAQNATAFRLGSGTARPSIDNYTLSSPIEGSNYSITLHGNKAIYSNGVYKLVFSVTIQALSNIVISEIGMFKGTYKTNSANPGDLVELLLGRGVFDTPITMNSGDIKVLEISIILQ